MRRDDRNDPFDELFRELERMMNEMIGFDAHVDVGPIQSETGFGSETHVDVYEEEDTVRIVADLPGIPKDNIDLSCDGEILSIHAESESREYDERIRLPTRVDEHSANATYNNGVLEVVFEQSEASASIDVE